jgi:hypothetical protein
MRGPLRLKCASDHWTPAQPDTLSGSAIRACTRRHKSRHDYGRDRRSVLPRSALAKPRCRTDASSGAGGAAGVANRLADSGIDAHSIRQDERIAVGVFAGRCCSRRWISPQKATPAQRCSCVGMHTLATSTCWVPRASWSSTSTISTRRCQVTADVAFTRFAEAYADRNEHDYATLCGA